MPRPRTKGEPIQVRLTLEVDEWFRARAEGESWTPSELAEGVIGRYWEDMRHLESGEAGTGVKYAVPSPSPRGPQPGPETERPCKHTFGMGSSGTLVCTKCRAPKGIKR